MEEEGFNINLEEASIIRELIENKEDNEKVELQKKYQEAISSLKKEQEMSKKQIEELKVENQRLSIQSTILHTPEHFEKELGMLLKTS